MNAVRSVPDLFEFIWFIAIAIYMFFLVFPKKKPVEKNESPIFYKEEKVNKVTPKKVKVVLPSKKPSGKVSEPSAFSSSPIQKKKSLLVEEPQKRTFKASKKQWMIHKILLDPPPALNEHFSRKI